jgi:hypothetical protein
LARLLAHEFDRLTDIGGAEWSGRHGEKMLERGGDKASADGLFAAIGDV